MFKNTSTFSKNNTLSLLLLLNEFQLPLFCNIVLSTRRTMSIFNFDDHFLIKPFPQSSRVWHHPKVWKEIHPLSYIFFSCFHLSSGCFWDKSMPKYWLQVELHKDKHKSYFWKTRVPSLKTIRESLSLILAFKSWRDWSSLYLDKSLNLSYNKLIKIGKRLLINMNFKET